MSRYIDADALIGRLDYCVKEGMGSTIAFTFKHMVEDAPSIDAVELGVDYRLDFYDVNYKSWCDEDGVEHMRTFCIERKEK